MFAFTMREIYPVNTGYVTVRVEFDMLLLLSISIINSVMMENVVPQRKIGIGLVLTLIFYFEFSVADWCWYWYTAHVCKQRAWVHIGAFEVVRSDMNIRYKTGLHIYHFNPAPEILIARVKN